MDEVEQGELQLVNDAQKKAHEDAFLWAEERKRDGEDVVIIPCPCCKELLAVYTTPNKLSYVADTNLAMPE